MAVWFDFKCIIVITIRLYTLPREELNTDWQAVIGIGKAVEFDKHHCSAELKKFLDVENAMVLNEVSCWYSVSLAMCSFVRMFNLWCGYNDSLMS